MSQSVPKPSKKWNNKPSKNLKRNRRKLEDLEDYRKARPAAAIKPQHLPKRSKPTKRDKKRQLREAQEFPGLATLFTEEARSLVPGTGILKFLGNATAHAPPGEDTEKAADSGFISLDASDEESALGQQFVQYEDASSGLQNQFPCPWLSPMQERADNSPPSGAESLKAQDPEETTKGVGEQIGNEVLEFLKYMSPSASEIKTRESCLTRLRNIVKQLWPGATVSVFGSYATGMYLPDADMDVVILSDEMRANLRSEMYRLSARLKNNVAEQVQVISHARVPIIKYVESGTKLSVDIAFGQQNGIQTADLVGSWLKENKALKPLAMVVRQFLKRRGLSEVANGGLGGYATICMVYSRLQQLLPQVENDLLGNVGLLLLDFFNYYGHEFDNTSEIVRPQKAPRCFPISKRKNGSMTTPKATGLAIEDPNDESNNISKASFNYVSVKRSFANAADYLKGLCIEWQRLPQRLRPSLSFLAPLLKFSEHEKQRQKAGLNDALFVGARLRQADSERHSDKAVKMTRRPGSSDHPGVKSTNRRINLNAKQHTSDERGRGVESYDPWKEIYTRTEPVDHSRNSGDASRNGPNITEAVFEAKAEEKDTNGISKRDREVKPDESVTEMKRPRNSDDEDDNDSRTKLTTAQRRQFWNRKAGTPDTTSGTAQASE